MTRIKTGNARRRRARERVIRMIAETRKAIAFLGDPDTIRAIGEAVRALFPKPPPPRTLADLPEDVQAEIAAMEPYACGCPRQIQDYWGALSLSLICKEHRVMVASAKEAISASIDRATEGLREMAEAIRERHTRRAREPGPLGGERLADCTWVGDGPNPWPEAGGTAGTDFEATPTATMVFGENEG